jgi:AAA domain-containing protein/LAGLIDADG DNA endonuclease family protein
MWPDLSGDPILSDHQRVTLLPLLRSRLAILGGSPGTGKTHTAAAVIRQCVDIHGQRHVAAAAPTGKAAVRLTAALHRNGIDLRATTIHRLLEVGRNGHESGDWGFKHNAGNRLEYTYYFIDEMSMVDTGLAASLLDALPAGAHVLLIGDIGQLPPVSHGAPLRDMIAAGVPYGELTEIRRNAGAIVHACAAIRSGKPFDTGDNFVHAEWAKPASILDEMIQQIMLAAGRDFDPIWDVQVLCAVNAKSELSRKKLNELLQNQLNPSGRQEEGNPFRVGDKVICLRNGLNSLMQMRQDDPPRGTGVPAPHVQAYEDAPGGAETFVANGEIGRVLAVAPHLSIVRFAHPERIIKAFAKRPKDDDEEEEDGAEDRTRFSLAYAITVHKCVHPNTLVETADGLLPIRSIAYTGMIATPQGKRPYQNFVSNSTGPALRITVEGGYSITVTPDHKVERWQTDHYEMVEANAVHPGNWMRLRLGVTIDPIGLVQLPKLPEGDIRAVRHRTPDAVNEDVAEFLGLMVADGTVYHSGFRLAKRHQDVLTRFQELCGRLFGVRARAVTIGKTDGFEVNSRLLSEWLQSLGGLCPRRKGIPECVLRSPLVIQNAFLRGLFEDGTVNLREDEADHVEWTSVEQEMVHIVQIMLLRNGIICSTQKFAATTENARPHFRLYIYGSHAARFRDAIGFVSEFKRSRLACCRDSETRNLVPMRHEELKFLRKLYPELMDKYTYQNGLARGYVSRGNAQRIQNGLPVEHQQLLTESLEYHHARVLSAEVTECPSMCIEVPDGHRFLQNGFPHGNSQGSEWPVVIYIVDEYPGAIRVTSREFCYTALSRAQKLCITIGRRSVLDQMCRRTVLPRRKTFLASFIAGVAT